MKILVTGGAGFIGSTVVDAYLRAGHDVVVVDDLSSGSADNVDPRARLHRVDLRTAQLDDVFATERPEIVNHHAAQVSVSRSVEDPLHDATVNVLGSLNLLEAARRHRTRRVIFASTGGAIYGEPDVLPADENHACRPRSPYAVAKLSVEHYLDYFRAIFGLETVVLRYANVYGPRQDPHGEAGVIAIFMQQIQNGLAPAIFGDGEQTRDFVFVGDVVRANVAALDVATHGELKVFNVATGCGTSVNELWDVIAAVARPTVTPSRGPDRAGDVRHSVLDPRLAARELGWTPSVPLAEGIERTWQWFVKRAARDRCAV